MSSIWSDIRGICFRCCCAGAVPTLERQNEWREFMAREWLGGNTYGDLGEPLMASPQAEDSDTNCGEESQEEPS